MKLTMQMRSELESGLAKPLSRAHEIIFVSIIISAQLVSQITIAQGLSPLNIIGEWFQLQDSPKLSWSIASITLTQGTFIVISGKLGDLFGHKLIFTLGYFALAFWSLLTGISYYSHSAIFYFVCKGFQGLCTSLLIPNGLAILGRTYPPGVKKNFIFAAFGAGTPVGFVVGCAFGAILSSLTPWYWVYFTTAIVCFFLGVMALFLIPSDGLKWEKRGSFDYLGAFSGVIGLMLFNIAWNQAAIVGWQEAYTYILLIISLLAIAVFVIVELRVNEPLIPIREMSPSTLRILGCVGCGFGTFGIWIYYFWTYLLSVENNSALLAAAKFCPVAIAGICAAVFTAFLFTRGIPTTFIMILALLGFLIPSILLSTIKENEVYWASCFVSTIIAPFGVDICFPAATLLLSNSVSHDKQGISASLVVTVVNYSISIGLGIAGTAVENLKPSSDLESIHIASYVAIGLCGLGIILAIYGTISETWKVKESEKSATKA